MSTESDTVLAIKKKVDKCEWYCFYGKSHIDNQSSTSISEFELQKIIDEINSITKNVFDDSNFFSIIQILSMLSYCILGVFAFFFLDIGVAFLVYIPSGFLMMLILLFMINYQQKQISLKTMEAVHKYIVTLNQQHSIKQMRWVIELDLEQKQKRKCFDIPQYRIRALKVHPLNNNELNDAVDLKIANPPNNYDLNDKNNHIGNRNNHQNKPEIVKIKNSDQHQQSWKEFKVGDKIDCRDRWGIWYETIIAYHKLAQSAIPKNLPLSNVQQKNVNKLQKLEAIYVHYTEWEEKWNEWLFIGDDTICECNYSCVTEKTEHRISRPNTQSKYREERKKDEYYSEYPQRIHKRKNKNKNIADLNVHRINCKNSVSFVECVDILKEMGFKIIDIGNAINIYKKQFSSNDNVSEYYIESIIQIMTNLNRKSKEKISNNNNIDGQDDWRHKYKAINGSDNKHSVFLKQDNKQTIAIHGVLVAMGFEPKYIDRAFKIYEKNYGRNYYKIDVITEIIVRLQNKDKTKRNCNTSTKHRQLKIAKQSDNLLIEDEQPQNEGIVTGKMLCDGRKIVIHSENNKFDFLIGADLDDLDDAVYVELLSSIKSYFEFPSNSSLSFYEKVNGSKVTVDDIDDVIDGFVEDNDVLHLYVMQSKEEMIKLEIIENKIEKKYEWDIETVRNMNAADTLSLRDNDENSIDSINGSVPSSVDSQELKMEGIQNLDPVIDIEKRSTYSLL